MNFVSLEPKEEGDLSMRRAISWAVMLGVLGLAFGVLLGCGPAQEPTLPPPTKVALAPTETPVPPTQTSLPATQTPLPPTMVPSITSSPSPQSPEKIKLVILHTNDVYGEIDPCG